MATIDTTLPPLSESDHGVQLRRAVIASTVGTTIEWYDFLLYSTVTGLVFGKLFFPHSDPLVGVLEAFAIYTVGFIARPIGAAIFGHYGDRLGRKGALIATLLLTGLATAAVGLVPTYEQVGVWGAVILTIIRFIQGVGVGRLGTAVDGVGADQRAPRLHHILAAAWRSRGIAASQCGGAGVQSYFR
jgi:MFS family permease